MNTQEAQNTENETFFGISRVFLYDFLQTFFACFSKLFYGFFTAVKEVNSKHSQISRSLINFQGKILIFKEFQVPLKWHFKFKHFSRTSRTCTSPVIDFFKLEEIYDYQSSACRSKGGDDEMERSDSVL